MPVSHQLKIIFVHIPKTAGTSLEYALGMHGNNNSIGIEPNLLQEKNFETLFGAELQHLNVVDIRKHVGTKVFNEYFKFSVVRNPFDRLVSYFAWLHGQKGNKHDFLPTDFQKIIMRYKKRSLRYGMPELQYKYIMYKNTTPLDAILRFEALTEGIKSLSERLSLEIDLEHRMISKHIGYKKYYDDQTIEFVKHKYYKDFLYFGYDLEI